MPYSSAHRTDLRVVRRHIPPQRRPRSPWLKVILAALAGALLLGAGGAMYIHGAQRPDTVALKAGSVEMTQEIEGLVVRQEKVYTAPAAGRVKRIAAEGQRVRVGTVVAQIVGGTAAQASPPASSAPPASGDTTAIRKQVDDLAAAIYQKAAAINDAKAKGDTAAAARLQAEADQLSRRQADLARQLSDQAPAVVTAAPAPQAEPQGPVLGALTVDMSGLLTYQTDGLEVLLAPGKEWTPSTLRGLTGQLRSTPETVAQGDPVLKVIDSLSISLVAVVPEQALARLQGKLDVTMRFTGREGPPVVARIAKQVKEGADVALLLTAPVFPEELGHQRRFRATLVLGGATGLIVPRSAIDVRDGVQGVWVAEGTETRFHPVRVVGGNDAEVALETDLHAGLRVLRSAPSWMR